MDRKWILRFLDLADRIAGWSKDPSSQVGCVVVDGERRLIGAGYNGFPRGVGDDPSRYSDREKKIHLVQHAEANAITQATASLQGASLFSTHPPCSGCAGLIVQAGIEEVFAWHPDSSFIGRNLDTLEAGNLILDEAGVGLTLVETPGLEP